MKTLNILYTSMLLTLLTSNASLASESIWSNGIGNLLDSYDELGGVSPQSGSKKPDPDTDD